MQFGITRRTARVKSNGDSVRLSPKNMANSWNLQRIPLALINVKLPQTNQMTRSHTHVSTGGIARAFRGIGAGHDETSSPHTQWAQIVRSKKGKRAVHGLDAHAKIVLLNEHRCSNACHLQY